MPDILEHVAAKVGKHQLAITFLAYAGMESSQLGPANAKYPVNKEKINKMRNWTLKEKRLEHDHDQWCHYRIASLTCLLLLP